MSRKATHDPALGEKKQSWYLHLKAFADVANQVSIAGHLNETGTLVVYSPDISMVLQLLDPQFSLHISQSLSERGFNNDLSQRFIVFTNL